MESDCAGNFSGWETIPGDYNPNAGPSDDKDDCDNSSDLPSFTRGRTGCCKRHCEFIADAGEHDSGTDIF